MQMMPKMSWPQRLAGDASSSDRMVVDAVDMSFVPKIVFVRSRRNLRFLPLFREFVMEFIAARGYSPQPGIIAGGQSTGAVQQNRNEPIAAVTRSLVKEHSRRSVTPRLCGQEWANAA